MSNLVFRQESPSKDIYEKYNQLLEKYGELYFATKAYFEAKNELETFLENVENEVIYE